MDRQTLLKAIKDLGFARFTWNENTIEAFRRNDSVVPTPDRYEEIDFMPDYASMLMSCVYTDNGTSLCRTASSLTIIVLKRSEDTYNDVLTVANQEFNKVMGKS